MTDQLSLKRLIALHWHPWMSPNCRCRACRARRGIERLFALQRDWRPHDVDRAHFLTTIIYSDVHDRNQMEVAA